MIGEGSVCTAWKAPRMTDCAPAAARFLQRELRDLLSPIGEVVATAAGLRDCLQQPGVCVIADRDGRDRGPIGAGFGDQLDVRVLGAGLRFAVREQHHMADIGIDVTDGIQPDLQRRVDLGPAGRLQLADRRVHLLASLSPLIKVSG